MGSKLGLFHFFKESISDLSYLMFPPVCICCGDVLVTQEDFVCYKCLVELPRTNFHREKGNPVEMMFWGRVKIRSAASFFFFQKGSRYQVLLHFLKYKGLKELGVLLGRLYASELNGDGQFQDIDLIVPVPLHPKKEKARGYNQSLAICEGISQQLRKPIECNNLCRVIYSETQTRKGRWERWQNVEALFSVSNPTTFLGMHVLLVDDVVTTGSTLEACANVLMQSPGCSVSILTLAYASV